MEAADQVGLPADFTDRSTTEAELISQRSNVTMINFSKGSVASRANHPTEDVVGKQT
jgi:hypothetical protein